MISTDRIIELIGGRIDNYTYVEYLSETIDSYSLLRDPYFVLERILTGNTKALIKECENTLKLISIETGISLRDELLEDYKIRLFKLVIVSTFIYLISPEINDIVYDKLSYSNYLVGVSNATYDIIDNISHWFNGVLDNLDLIIENNSLVVTDDSYNSEEKLRMQRIVNAIFRLVSIVSDKILKDNNVKGLLKKIHVDVGNYIESLDESEKVNTKIIVIEIVPVMIEFSGDSLLTTFIVIESV